MAKLWSFFFVLIIVNICVAQTEPAQPPPLPPSAVAAPPPVAMPATPPPVRENPAPVVAKTPAEQWDSPLLFARQMRDRNVSFQWPEIDINYAEYFKGVNINSKNIKSEISTAVASLCADIVAQYEKQFKASQKLSSFDNYFSSICERVDYEINHEAPLHEPDFVKHLIKLVGPSIVGRLDFSCYNYSVSYTRKQTILSDQLERSYEASPFSKLGVPYKSFYLVSQVLIVAAFLMSLAALVKDLLRK